MKPFLFIIYLFASVAALPALAQPTEQFPNCTRVPNPLPQSLEHARLAVADNKVAVYYVVPSDAAYSEAEYNAIVKASREIQAWFQINTGGVTYTFAYADTVEVYRALQNTAYYQEDWWGRLLPEMQAQGHPIWQPGIVTSLWIKTGNPDGIGLGTQWCGSYCGVAMAGVENFPEFNYFGKCPNIPGSLLWPCNPNGIMAHELGHAFGLPHPYDFPGTRDVAYHSVMQTPWNYPNIASESDSPWGLLTIERQKLLSNPFLYTDIKLKQIYEADLVNLPVTGPVPNAAFTYTKNGDEVYFSNMSSGATYYYWTFGDGQVSNSASPTHTYQGSGPFKVTLWASNAVQMMDTASVIIRAGSPQVLSFTLIDASKDKDIMTLSDGAIISLKEMEETFDVEKFNIRANTSAPVVVKLELSGIEDHIRVDDVAPYALFGDNRKGDYYSWEPELGFYTLKATPHAGTKEDLGAPIGPTQIINFRIIRKQIHQEEQVLSFTLIDASKDKNIMMLSDGAIISLKEMEREFDAEKFNIRANTTAPVVVKFELSGEEHETRIDDVPPYALFGDNRKGDYYSWEPETGDYKLKATPHAGTKEDMGEPNGPTLTIHFKVVKEAGTIAEAELAQAARQEPDKLTLYPNPTPDGRVQVQLSGQLQGQVRYRLFSSVGEKLAEGILDPTNAGNLLEFDFSSQTKSTGLYFLRIEGTNMNQVLRIIRR